MQWAWHQTVPSTPKFVLLTLADAADDNGVCWPSISTIAKRCAMSTRTVRRALQELIKADFIYCEARHRGDGSTTSNRYVLNLREGDTVSGAPDINATGEGHQCQWGPIPDVTPRTTNRTVIDPSPPLDDGLAVSGTGNSGGEFIELVFPTEFTTKECTEATRRLETLPTTLAQQLLDELSSRMERGGIKTTPLAYLGGLINRARAGTFVPDKRRPTNQRTGRSQTYVESPAPPVEISRESLPIYADVTNNPLCQRVAELQHRAAQRSVPQTAPSTTPVPARPQDTNDESVPANNPVESPPARVKFPELARVIGD
jgi:hypothetical protein